MIKFLMSLVFGKCKCTFDSANAEKVIEIIRVNALTTEPIKRECDEYSVILSDISAKKLREFTEDNCIECSFRRLFGIPLLFERYKYRPGILVGAVIFFVTVLLSGRIVWDIDVTGNKTISDIEIIEALENRGFHPGIFINDVDFDMLQNDCLIDKDELAWVSVNMDGNLARVEVREKRVVPVEDPPAEGRFANIIAAEDGMVEICRIKNGKAVVEYGDTVKKGELLVTGVIDVGEDSVRYEYADGEVLAKVYREIVSYVPFEYKQKIPTGEKKREIQLKIFGKSINLSHRGSIDGGIYGTIKEEEKLSLPFGISLPVWMKNTEYSRLVEKTVLLTEDEAVSMARSDVTKKLHEMSDSFQLLSKSEKTDISKNGVKVTLCVYGITDISANYGFSVSEYDTEENEEKSGNEENHNS